MKAATASFAARLEQAWYANAGWIWLLLPLSWLYQAVVYCRRYFLGKRQIEPLAAPVIVVGNLTVGGTGKTPQIISLVKHFQQQGFKPGVISRGYGGQTTYPCLLTSQSMAAEVGDEPLLIAQHCPVVVDPNRYQAASHLLKQTDCNLVLSDDGLQHYPLPRDIEIVVVDGNRHFGNRLCLPAGPLREPVSRLEEVDFVLVNGGTLTDQSNMSGSNLSLYERYLSKLFFSQVQPQVFRNLSTQKTLPLADMPRGPVHAVAGIGNPQRFADTLQELGFMPQLIAYPDHHIFSGEEFEFYDGLPVIITAKDAVKCQGIKDANIWVLDITANPAAEFFTALDRKLEQHIA